MNRVLWVRSRIAELPWFSLFLYKLLIDPRLTWHVKAHPFALLRYIVEPFALIPREDPALGHIDNVTMTLYCCNVLRQRVQPAIAGVYKEALYAQQIPYSRILDLAPFILGGYYTHIGGMYRSQLEAHRPYLGSVVHTRTLIRDLRTFSSSFKAPKGSPADDEKLEAFLASHGSGQLADA